MHCAKKLWNNVKNQPDLWFFYGFLLTFTLSIRKVLFFYPIQKEFNEYTGIYLYLSDIFLFLTLFFWGLSKLCNKNIILSIKTTGYALYKPIIQKIIFKYYLSIPLFLVLWSFLSTTWSQNQSLSLFRSIQLLGICLLYTYLIHKISTNKSPSGSNFFLQDSCKIIVFIGTLQSAIAISQFILQHSIGFFWLKESFISPDIPGVAKIVFDGEKVIRAYGLFPHPNILGGFLLFSIILTYYYHKLFHACPPMRGVEHFYPKNSSPWKRGDREGIEKDSDITKFFNPSPTPSFPRRGENEEKTIHSSPYPLLTKEGREASCSTWNNLEQKVFKNTLQLPTIVPRLPADVPRGTIWNIILALQILALFLTFSKSAIIGLIIAFLYINTCNIKYKRTNNVPRGTLLPRSLSKVVPSLPTNVPRLPADEGGGTFLKLIVLSSLLILLIPLALPKLDTNSFFLKSLNERIEYLNVSRGTILDNPIIGLGSGQFVLTMQKYASDQLQIWQFQPVHNVFLLIWSELGLVGLGLFVVFLWKMFHACQSLFHACPPMRGVEHFYPKNSSPWKRGDREGIEKDSDITKFFNPSPTPSFPRRGENEEKTIHSSPYPLLTKDGRGTSCSTPARRCSTWNNLSKSQIKNVPRLPADVPRGTILPSQHQKFLINTLSKAILLGLIFIMLFDHYLWDIHQGQIVLWITLGLLVGTSQKIGGDTHS